MGCSQYLVVINWFWSAYSYWFLGYDASQAIYVGNQGGGVPFLALETNDCLGDYKKLSSQGVQFADQPKTMPWGTGVTMIDSEGNYIYLNQPA